MHHAINPNDMFGDMFGCEKKVKRKKVRRKNVKRLKVKRKLEESGIIFQLFVISDNRQKVRGKKDIILCID